MLDFWYSARCTRQVKLIVCIMTCAMIYLCSTVQALSAVLTGFSLGLGISMHLLRQLNLKIKQNNIYKNGLSILLYSVPLAVFLILLYVLPDEHKMILGLQVLGFTALGLFIVSIYENRAKRFK